jgi:hypothetical protein
MKFRIGLVVGAVAFGLALVNPTATASPTFGTAAAADPYPRTVKTICDARALKNPYRAGKKERWRMIIIENSTDLPRVRLSYVKQKKMANGKYKTVRKYRPKRYYHGKPINLPFMTSRNGTFRVLVKTNFPPDSQFRNCRDSFVFHVAGANSPTPPNNNNGNGNTGELPGTGQRND